MTLRAQKEAYAQTQYAMQSRTADGKAQRPV
jgi:hypothetical protein